MRQHSRAVQLFQQSEFHSKGTHRRNGAYDPGGGHGSAGDRQGPPSIHARDNTRPMTGGSAGSSASVDSALSDRNGRSGYGSASEHGGSPFITTGEDLPWGPSASTETPAAQQRRIDGPVRFAASFENLQTEAGVLWKSGIDLELSNNSSQDAPKRKWMTELEFENFAGSAAPSSDQSASPVAAAAAQSPPSSAVTGSSSNPKRTFAQAAGSSDVRATVGWTPEEEQVVPAAPPLLQPTPYPEYPGSASSRLPLPPLQASHMPLAADHISDSKMYRELYSMSIKLYQPETAEHFHKNMERILLQCRRFSERTFGMLIRVLVSQFKQERSEAPQRLREIKVATLIRKNWITFHAASNDYIHIAVLTPIELLPLLELFALFAHAYPGYEGIPLPILQKRFHQIKTVFEAQAIEQSEIFLRDIGRDISAARVKAAGSATSSERKDTDRDVNWTTEWDRFKIPLPAIPDAERIVQESRLLLDTQGHKKGQGAGVARPYPGDQHCLERIANIINTPYPSQSIYLAIHYVLLREELLGPLYQALRQYGLRTPAVERDQGWTMVGPCKALCTTFFPTFNEPVIVFELSNPAAAAGLPLEGSLALLVPMHSSTSAPPSWDALSREVVKCTIVSTQTCRYGTSMVAIHVDQQQVSKINWTLRYTVLSGDANAVAAIPVLDWLQEQCTQINERNLSAGITPLLLSPASSAESPDRHLNSTPSYLCQVSLDISNIIVSKLKDKGFKAQIGETEETSRWPEHSMAQRALPPSHREPLYTLSPSQLKAVQYALTHQVTMISGTEGTGKTHVASKLVELMYQALLSGQCFQPILVLTQRESTLDDILGRVSGNIPNVTRLGAQPVDEALRAHQVIRVAKPNVCEPGRKHYQLLEKKIARWQGQLSALWHYRWRIESADPAVMVTTLPPYSRQAMVQSCLHAIKQPLTEFTMEDLWSFWIDDDAGNARNRTVSRNMEAEQEISLNAFSATGRRVQPIMERTWFEERRKWIEEHTPRIPSLADDSTANWPLPTSAAAYETRKKMVRIWTTVQPENLWNLPRAMKHQLRRDVIVALLDIIDANITIVLDEQIKAAKVLEEERQKRWLATCRFSRVIGMTAECAAQNTEFVLSLWPRAVIMDEAHEILESATLPYVLGSRMEHVIMVGDHQSMHRPVIHNPNLRGNPKHLDISLFERWKRLGGSMVRLEEQWRMCKEIAGIHDSVAMPTSDRSLLITAPTASENCVNDSSVVLTGISKHALFIDHIKRPNAEETIHNFFSRLTGTNVNEQDADEARFASHLALYLFLQGYKASQIVILTASPIQKRLIQAVMREHIQPYSVFSKGALDGISTHCIDEYSGKESQFVVLSLRMPAGGVLSDANVALALSRAHFGLYIIGSVRALGDGTWANVAQQMKLRGALVSAITLTCKNHPESSFSVSCYKDFDNLRNGGCRRACNTLLDCGHPCKQYCHHLKHSSAKIRCMQPCAKPRPGSCQHQCPNKCYECKDRQCPPCMEMTAISLSCGHTVSGRCNQVSIDKHVCQEMVEHKLPCGHKCVIQCHLAHSAEASPIDCKETVQAVLNCGHCVSTTCGYKPVCTESCKGRLECGHLCPKPCGYGQHAHTRDMCIASCPKQLICGHNCSKGCASLEHTDRCLEPCRHVCSHGYKCGRDCWMACNSCINQCPYQCEHKRCTKKCYEKCDRLPCEESCLKALQCSHPCSGLCGEPCPPCKQCNPDIKCSISLRTLSEFEEGEKIYKLPECGCVFALDSLDLYFSNQAKSGEHTAIKLWQCPSCQKPIYTALRYNTYIKTEIALVNQIKAQQEESRQLLSQSEKQDIIDAMNAETRTGAVHNIVGGRWFVCENGHPYYIGECGGATEISHCPHCGAVIGGLQHKVVDSNRFYGEFDGSFQPAWPGQPN